VLYAKHSLSKKGRSKLSHKLPWFSGHSCSPLNPSTLSLSIIIHLSPFLLKTQFPSPSLNPLQSRTPKPPKSLRWQELVAIKHPPRARLLTQDHYETNYEETGAELGWVLREHHRHLHRHNGLYWYEKPSLTCFFDHSIYFWVLEELGHKISRLEPWYGTFGTPNYGLGGYGVWPDCARVKIKGNEAKSIRESKDYDVGHTEDSHEDEPILHFKLTVPTKPWQ